MCLCFCCLEHKNEKKVNFVHAERSPERSGTSNLQREKVDTWMQAVEVWRPLVFTAVWHFFESYKCCPLLLWEQECPSCKICHMENVLKNILVVPFLFETTTRDEKTVVIWWQHEGTWWCHSYPFEVPPECSQERSFSSMHFWSKTCGVVQL